MKTTQILTLVLSACLALLLGACQADISRNPDGSLTVESTVAQADLQAKIDAALDDRKLQSLEVDLQDGSIAVRGERRRDDGSQVVPLSFRLELRAEDGRLVARVSEAQLGDHPLDEQRLANWNERIGKRLARLGERRPNRSLQSVSVTEDSLQLIWRVETPSSKP